MNQRIMELAKKAAEAEGWGPEVWQTTFTEKLAELIVRECADVAAHVVTEREGVDFGLVEACYQHFGIKEMSKTEAVTADWYENDQLHRLDGPAVEWGDGYREWWQDGVQLTEEQRRVDGPAKEYADGRREWYLNGQQGADECDANDRA